MFTWNVEKMALLNEKDNKYVNNASLNRKEKIYHCEKEVSREDKIAFVDSLQNGKLSYLLSLIEKFNQDKEDMPKDKWENVKTNSLKAWIKKNDTKYNNPLLDDYYHYGSFNLLGTRRSIQIKGWGSGDIYEDLVDEVFHRQLKELEKEEQAYFLEHDEYSILKKRFREKTHLTTFGVNITDWSDGRLTISNPDNTDEERDITIEELKELLSKYEQLDALAEKLTAETHIVY